MQPAEASGQVSRREDVAGPQRIHQVASQFHREIQVAQRRKQSGPRAPRLITTRGGAQTGCSFASPPNVATRSR